MNACESTHAMHAAAAFAEVALEERSVTIGSQIVGYLLGKDEVVGPNFPSLLRIIENILEVQAPSTEAGWLAFQLVWKTRSEWARKLAAKTIDSHIAKLPPFTIIKLIEFGGERMLSLVVERGKQLSSEVRRQISINTNVLPGWAIVLAGDYTNQEGELIAQIASTFLISRKPTRLDGFHKPNADTITLIQRGLTRKDELPTFRQMQASALMGLVHNIDDDCYIALRSGHGSGDFAVCSRTGGLIASRGGVGRVAENPKGLILYWSINSL